MSRQTFIGEILWWTPRAVLFRDHFWCEPEWYPLSQVEIQIDYASQEFTMIASNWITRQKNIIEFVERPCAESDPAPDEA